MKYINVRISDDEHAWIKEAAKAQKTTVQEFMRRMIETARSKKKTWLRGEP